MRPNSDIPVGTWVTHRDFGVGQVCDTMPNTHRGQTCVFYPAAFGNPNEKPKRRRVSTISLQIDSVQNRKLPSS